MLTGGNRRKVSVDLLFSFSFLSSLPAPLVLISSYLFILGGIQVPARAYCRKRKVFLRVFYGLGDVSQTVYIQGFLRITP